MCIRCETEKKQKNTIHLRMKHKYKNVSEAANDVLSNFSLVQFMPHDLDSYRVDHLVK